MLHQHRSLILASASPRRQDLLKDAGLTFDVLASEIPELPAPDEAPDALACRLALAKATAIATTRPDAWVLGADTDVSINGQILGKPSDAEDAKRLLRMIQGRSHQVWGGFALVCKSLGISHVESLCTIVEMAPMDEATICWYVGTGEPLDKAGAYGAQGIGAQFITAVTGSFTNVVGLPIRQVMSVLSRSEVYRRGK